MSSDLYISVQVAGEAGSGLLCQAFKSADFVTSPQHAAVVPATSPIGIAITDGSGDAEFTGLTDDLNYWVQVVDARGVNNWFYVGTAYLNNSSGSRFVCTIPWTTPTNVTQPISTGGDTRVGQSLRQKCMRHIRTYTRCPLRPRRPSRRT